MNLYENQIKAIELVIDGTILHDNRYFEEACQKYTNAIKLDSKCAIAYTYRAFANLKSKLPGKRKTRWEG